MLIQILDNLYELVLLLGDPDVIKPSYCKSAKRSAFTSSPNTLLYSLSPESPPGTKELNKILPAVLKNFLSFKFKHTKSYACITLP